MKPFSIILFFLLLTVLSCKQPGHTDKKNHTALPQEKETKSFFPVTSYLKGQLVDIKNSGKNPIRLSESNGKKDSVWLKVEEMETAFADFLAPVIDSVTLSAYFTEKSFFDQTLNAVTLTYDPIVSIPASIPYQHWDIYIDPEKNTVQRIYIVKRIAPDKVRQLTWQSGKWCRGITVTDKQNGQSTVENEVTIKWDY